MNITGTICTHGDDTGDALQIESTWQQLLGNLIDKSDILGQAELLGISQLEHSGTTVRFVTMNPLQELVDDYTIVFADTEDAVNAALDLGAVQVG